MSKYIKLEDALNCVNGYFLTGIHKAIESLPTIEVSEDCENCKHENEPPFGTICGSCTKANSENFEPKVSEDAISREGLLNTINAYMTGSQQVEHMKSIIKSAPSVVPKPKEGEWISCSERLPERLERVLVTRANGRVEETFKWNNKEYPWRGGYDDVIAWMPLPKPWKGADDVEC